MKKIIMSFLLVAVSASSFGLEVAFIDMKNIFDNYYKTKNADAALSTQREAMKDLAEKMVEQIKGMEKEYYKLREEAENVVLSKEQRDAKAKAMIVVEKQVAGKVKELEKYKAESVKKIRVKYEKVRDEITKELTDYLATYAKNKKLDLIMDVSGDSANGIPFVVYYTKDKDITAVILSTLNAGHEDSKTESK